MLKASRYCTVKDHQAETTSRICTYNDCQSHSRWVCQECVVEEIHKHDQLNNSHLMKDQEFTKFIKRQQAISQEDLKPILKYFQQSITQLKDIIKINLSMIKELEFIQKQLSEKRAIYQKLINTTKNNFFNLDLNMVNEIIINQPNYKQYDIKKLESLSSVIYQQRNLLKQTYEEKLRQIGDARTANSIQLNIIESQNELSVIKQKRNLQLQSKDKRCVLLGNTRSGKTRLFNKICSQNEQSDSSLEIKTKMIVQSKSVSGYGFHLQDTPGFGQYDDQFLTYYIRTLAALTDGPIHRIILVVQYQSRIEELKYQIQETINIVQEYHQLISIIITYKDQCIILQVDEYFNKAQEMIKKCFEVQSVYFSGYDTKCEELCLFIDKALLQDGQMINISNSKFDKSIIPYVAFELRKAEEQIKPFVRILKGLQSDRNGLQNITSAYNLDLVQYLNNFISCIRSESEEIYKKFEDTHQQWMIEINNNPLNAFYYHIILKNQIKRQVEELISFVKIQFKYYDDKDAAQFESQEINPIQQQFNVYKQNLVIQSQRDKKLLYNK